MCQHPVASLSLLMINASGPPLIPLKTHENMKTRKIGIERLVVVLADEGETLLGQARSYRLLSHLKMPAKNIAVEGRKKERRGGQQGGRW